MQTIPVIIGCISFSVVGLVLACGYFTIKLDRISNSFDNALRDLRTNYSKLCEHNMKLCSFISSHWGDFNG